MSFNNSPRSFMFLEHNERREMSPASSNRSIPTSAQASSHSPLSTPLQTTTYPPTPPTAQTIILSDASARLSSSPGSSPRIVEPHVPRARSLPPKMLPAPDRGAEGAAGKEFVFMHRGIEPGADFFDSGSSADEYDEYGEEEEEEEEEDGVERGRNGDDGEWEDDDENDDATRSFASVEGASVRRSGMSDGSDAMGVAEMERERDIRVLGGEAWWPFNRPLARDSGTGRSSGEGFGADNELETGEDEDGREGRLRRSGTKKARQMSLRRLGKANVVHNRGSQHGSVSHGTPRASIASNDEGESVGDMPAGIREGDGGRLEGENHRRKASESLSAVLKTHAITMHALESLSPSASLSLANVAPTAQQRYRQPGPQEFAPSLPHPLLSPAQPRAYRHINIPPLALSADDPDRCPKPPAHFVKTPYPFTSRKEFPKSRTRPHRHHVHSYHKARQVAGLGSSKGHQVLGLVASDSEVDWGSCRKTDSRWAGRKGFEDLGVGGRVRRAHSERGRGRRVWGGGDDGGALVKDGYHTRDKERETELDISVLCLSLRHRRGDDGVVRGVERIFIPSSRMTTISSSPAASQRDRDGNSTHDYSIDKSNSKAKTRKSPTLGKGKEKEKEKRKDAVKGRAFDDQFLAEQLRAAYKKLTGSWARRALSARTLKYIRLSRVGVWRWDEEPGVRPSSAGPTSTVPNLLLAARGAFHRFPNPNSLSSSDTDAEAIDVRTTFTEQELWDLYRDPRIGKAKYTWVHWARRVAACNLTFSPVGMPMSGSNSMRGREGKDEVPSAIVTVQFVHSFSPLRILFTISSILLTSILAALLWVFLGVNGWWNLRSDGRGERVGPGMLVGMLALGVQGIVFAAWVWGSWWFV